MCMYVHFCVVCLWECVSFDRPIGEACTVAAASTAGVGERVEGDNSVNSLGAVACESSEDDKAMDDGSAARRRLDLDSRRRGGVSGSWEEATGRRSWQALWQEGKESGCIHARCTYA
jgi:hypothetical protein